MDEYEYIRENAKNIVAAFVFYSNMGKTDLHRYALVQLILVTSRLTKPHENCKTFRKPYLKQCLVQLKV